MFSGRKGPCSALSPLSQAMLRAPLLGRVAGKPLTNPIPSMHVPLLTSVKKPAIPAWHEPCSSPYFFLYSGGEKGRKKKLWSSLAQHMLFLPALLHSLERYQHAKGFINGSTTMAASSPTSGVKQGARTEERAGMQPRETLNEWYHRHMTTAALSPQ